jgi:tetratricopeptide (TPR) repeat protein
MNNKEPANQSSQEKCELLPENALNALVELSNLHFDTGNNIQAIKSLNELAQVQKQLYGHTHISLANTYKKMGICLANIKKLDDAIKCLRDAVIRYQTNSKATSEELIDTLCILASVYRKANKFSRARTCITQTHALIAESDTPSLMQIRTLEELAAITLAQNKYVHAKDAFIKVIKLKQEAFGNRHYECIDPLMQLGICYYSLHEFTEAEIVFTQAIEIINCSQNMGQTKLSEALEKLSGVYRKQSRFTEADFLEQAATEIIGRGIDLRLGILKDFGAGVAAQNNKHYDIAQSCYRQALNIIEQNRDKSPAERIPLLGRLLQIADLKKHKVQAISLASEIEDTTQEIFSQFGTKGYSAQIRLARLFRLTNRNLFADTCYYLAARFARNEKSSNIISIFEEHASLLELMGEHKEHQRMLKKIRRLLHTLHCKHLRRRTVGRIE